MLIIPGQRSFGISTAPSCNPSHVRVNLHKKGIDPVELVCLAPTHMKNISMLGEGYVGMIIMVGNDIANEEFKIGNVVAGVTIGGWVNAVDGSSQKYLDLQPHNLWHISATTANKFGFYPPAPSDGCVIS
ncbi:hypothetical protein FRB97_002025 [Tulasnella sp. 331]|nr:hypothetical protein FRB97_002025 [Tulasnella sp. 331]